MEKIIMPIKGFFKNKNLKYGVNSVVVAAAAVAVAIVLNLLVGLLDFSLDLTSNKMFTVSLTTVALLERLETDVEIIGLFNELELTKTNDDMINDALAMLENYKKDPHIKVRYIDPDRNPGTINELDPEGKLDLKKDCFVVRRVLENGQSKSRKLTLDDLFEFDFDQQTYRTYVSGMNAEEAFSGAIRYVASDWTPMVYFVTGHEELDMDVYFTQLSTQLRRNNFDVATVNLASSESVPADAALLVFAAPIRDLLPQELDALLRYFQSGGRAVFLFDYDEAGTGLANFNRALEEFNVVVNNDKVRENETSHQVWGDPYFVAYDVAAGDVVQAGTSMLLYESRSISILRNDKDWITASGFISTTKDAVAEPVLASGAAREGPLDVAVAVENAGGAVRSMICVFGNATFITDQASGAYGQYYSYNINVFLDALSWMIGVPDAVYIPAKTYVTPVVTLTTRQMQFVRAGLLVALPLLIFGAGFVVFIKRRHL